jgi:hypothetical protein
MRWFSLFGISCLRCKFFVAPPNYKWTDLAKCTYHQTFAELARKNETQCGPSATYYIEKVND